jgi:hypothetical protein
MLTPSRSVITIAAAVASVGGLTAQVQSRGVLAGAPVALLVDGGVGGGLDGQTRVHRNGFTLAPTVPLPPVPSSADLSVILHPFGGDAVDIDDISTGRDDVLFNGNGVVDVPPNSWGVLSFSMRNGSLGQPGSEIAAQAAEGSIGAAVFTWMLPGSAVPAELFGPAVRSHSRAELGLPAAGTVEVDGLDVPLMLGLDQGNLQQLEPSFVPLIQNPQAIYFTVSSATCNLVPGWFVFGGQATPPSGATVLRVLKSSPGGTWTPPHVFLLHSTLGLAASEDIDGLAYDEARQRLLFSTRGTARDQFLFHDVSTDAPGYEDAKDQDGVKVSEKVGKLQNDDVDAICTLDPQLRSLGSLPPQGDDFGSSCGSPRNGLLGVPRVDASAFRRRQGGATFYDSWMIGWPPLTGPGPGFAVLFVTFGADLTLYPFGPIQLRDPTAAVPGDPIRYPLAVPSAIGDFDVTLHWVAIDANFTELAEARPLQLFL